MHPKPWHVEFEEYGGYDAMTHAFVVYDANNEVVIEVDQANFGQELCKYDFRSKEAEELAYKIAGLA